MTDVHNIGHVTHPQVGQVDAPQGNLGGQVVQPGLGERIKTAISEAGHAIKDFFSGLKAKFDNWKEGRAVAQAERQANREAERLVDSLKGGTFGPGDFGTLQSLMKHSARVDGANPEDLALRLIGEKLTQLTPEERKVALSTDLGTLVTQAKALAQQQLLDSANLCDALEQSGMGTPGGGDEYRNAIPGTLARIDGAFDMLRQKFEDVRTGTFQQCGHGAFQVDGHGSVTGTIVNAQAPGIDGLPPPPQGGHTPLTVIQAKGTEYVTSTKPHDFEDVGGVSIHTYAAADWHRMNIVFDDGTGHPYNTRLHGGTDEIDDKLGQSVDSLRALTGSDNSTKVLSCILHQHELRTIVQAMVAPSGDEIRFPPVPKGYDQARVTHDDGTVETFDNPGQIGDAQITVTRTPNGDFQIDVVWDYLTTGVQSGGTTEPVDPNNPTHTSSTPEERQTVVNCLKVHMTGSFVVSGTQAALGNLSILPGGQFQHDISGMISMPH